MKQLKGSRFQNPRSFLNFIERELLGNGMEIYVFLSLLCSLPLNASINVKTQLTYYCMLIGLSLKELKEILYNEFDISRVKQAVLYLSISVFCNSLMYNDLYCSLMYDIFQGSDSVTECMFVNGQVEVFQSYNSDTHSNSRLRNVSTITHI